MKNDPVHVAPADSDHRSAAGLALQRDETERLLHAWMNEEIRRAIVARQFLGIRAVRNPGHGVILRAQVA